MRNTKTSRMLVLALFLSSCASTIQSTRKYSNNMAYSNLEIKCTTPIKLYKYSNELCNNIKSILKDSDLSVSVNVKDEITPSLNNSDKTDSRKSLLIMEISHDRISTYNGKPSATLLNISARLSSDLDPFWAAKVQTTGNSITGPTNPEKVALQIISQMKTDGFVF